MRARGAEATDIVVLVVAADDGVMPQTLEAIHHARAAEVPIVVAVNKIDRENADPHRVLAAALRARPRARGLGRRHDRLRDLGPTRTSASTSCSRTCRRRRARGPAANPDRSCPGSCSKPTSTSVVARWPPSSCSAGTLKVGDPLVAGAAWGRVRALINDKGEQVKEAGPSTPVEVLGLSDVAEAGDDFVVAPDERKAAKVAETA
jgi:translation initiation factor IF-2